MKADKDLKDLFDGLDFDIAEPTPRHEDRFREKLRQQKKNNKPGHKGVIKMWLPVMSIAASFLIAVLLFQGIINSPFRKNRNWQMFPRR